jgi:hypothetical protein
MPLISEYAPVGDGNEAKKQYRIGNLHRQRRYELNKQKKP